MPESNFKKRALDFHQNPKPGKLAIVATKPLGSQEDLSLAYSPGVAAPCEEIKKNEAASYKYTARSNLVAVMTNGTAVLGLGNIGAAAAKPVMEGKAVLFKQFADIDVFDIEINETIPDKFVDIVTSLEPTFGGINLEDIKAPECFEIENKLKKNLNIPVFHDDQHGTAIIVSAAVKNALFLSGHKLENVKIVCTGAGAAALATLNMLLLQGAKKENITVFDLKGVLNNKRVHQMDIWRRKFARDIDDISLEQALDGANIYIGLSAGGILKPAWVKKMADKPLILALANPTPEIFPEEVEYIRDDAMIGTGRSDYPNQVNNVLCFPYIFRGALDCGATKINQEIKIACIDAISSLAQQPLDSASSDDHSNEIAFGPKRLIPSPFDKRLILAIAPAVAEAANKSNVAARPIKNIEDYREKLSEQIFRSGLLMKPVFKEAKKHPKRIIFADGEDIRVIKAAGELITSQIAQPILIGRPNVVNIRAKQTGVSTQLLNKLEIINPENDPRYRKYVNSYFNFTCRMGIKPEDARRIVRTNTTVIGAIAVTLNDADALIAGPSGKFTKHLDQIQKIIQLKDEVKNCSSLSVLITSQYRLFITDAYINPDPDAEEITNSIILANRQMKEFGIVPKVALLSHSSFGESDCKTAKKMRKVLELTQRQAPDLIIDGEMSGDLALDAAVRKHVLPDNKLAGGEANLLVFPNQDAANICLTLISRIDRSLKVGPILLGTKKPAHILHKSVSTRGIVNMAVIASSENI